MDMNHQSLKTFKKTFNRVFMNTVVIPLGDNTIKQCNITIKSQLITMSSCRGIKEILS